MEPAFFYDPANLSLIAGLALLGLDWGRPPRQMNSTSAIVAGVSLLVAILGKKPLQRFQNADVEEDQSSDLIGRELTTTHEVTKQSGVVFWSGVEWQARLAEDAAVESLARGVKARVVRVENLALVLEPLS